MKVLAIIGSPKKTGNTIEQVRYFETQLKVKHAVDFEYLYLKDYNIEECVGCNNCFDKGESLCPLKDDVGTIISKINNADGTIWVTPIYSMHITYLLKKLIDRLAFIHHRPAFFNKPAYIIVVKGNQFSASIKYIKENLQSWGFNCTGKLGIPAIVNMPVTIQNLKLKLVKKHANNFTNEIINKRQLKPNLIQLLSFKMWQLRAGLQDETNADYKFFKDNNLFSKNYFYNTDIGILNAIISPLLFKFLVIYLKREFGDLKKGL
jgi:multimeric flavodoxin WrbA